jgi:predicted MPP superfamily phosphohydrolase
MVSGHTHKGQFWPFNLITSLLYENHYGLMNKGKTNYYTSSGFGTWGPPIRIGNRPEIVEIILNLK